VGPKKKKGGQIAQSDAKCNRHEGPKLGLKKGIEDGFGKKSNMAAIGKI